MLPTLSLLPPLLLLLLLLPPSAATSDPTPRPWPPQFHSVLLMNSTGSLSLADLWYDWPRGGNLHVIRDQLAAAPPLYDLEWNNGTSFDFTLSPPRSCRSAQLEVGILRPDWLAGAAYLGRETVDGFDCHVWTKADFIRYYEDVESGRPVFWVFYTGRAAHVMTLEVGAVLDDAEWQAPVYCFEERKEDKLEGQSISFEPAALHSRGR